MEITGDIFKYSVGLFPIVPIFLGFSFYWRQNKGDIVGGDISIPKALWLSYTICTWFFFPFLIALNPDIYPVFRYIIWFHLISWWIRGPLELIMIYKWFNWSPKYGIAHDLFHAIGLSLGLLLNPWIAHGVENRLTLIFLVILVIGTLAETVFAYIFFKIRGEKDHKVYFASNDPKWKRNNTMTWVVVISLYTHLLTQSKIILF